MFRMALESQRPIHSPGFTMAEIDGDVKALYGATQGKLGTDEVRIPVDDLFDPGLMRAR